MAEPLIPQKILSRKDEITAAFMELAEQHIQDLLSQKAEKKFSAKDFGALLFIHPRHLTNTIKLTTGVSPCDIMEERMLREVKRLLQETDLSVADIGYRFAYKEPTNFIKFFKGMTGTTPLKYRKSLPENQ